MQVLRVCSFSTFALPPAFPPCSCPLAFQRQVRRLTSRMSSESYPGYPECVVSCHGAGRLANSICPLLVHIPTCTVTPSPSVQKLDPSAARRYSLPAGGYWTACGREGPEAACGQEAGVASGPLVSRPAPAQGGDSDAWSVSEAHTPTKKQWHCGTMRG